MTKTVLAQIMALVVTFNLYGMEHQSNPANKNEIPLTVFYHREDTAGWKTVVKGKINSIGSMDEVEKDDISNIARSKTRAGVRLYSMEGVKKDDTLFVINDKNLITARMKVRSVFHSMSFGPMLVGYGNFRLANVGDRVVMRQEDQNSRYAYIYTARGKYYRDTGDTAQSINHFKKALEMDRGNPEAHFELGKLYLDDGILQLAYNEFNESYKNIDRIYDREDRFQLLKYMVDTRMRQAYETRLPKDLRAKYIQEGIKYAKDALNLKQDDAVIHYYLGVLYFRNLSPSDVDSKNHLLKVLEKDPENINASVILAELYYRHKNFEKSKAYAETALKIDPANERARYIKSLTDEKE